MAFYMCCLERRRRLVNDPSRKREPELLTDVTSVRLGNYGARSPKTHGELLERDFVRHSNINKKLGNDAVAILVTLRGQVLLIENARTRTKWVSRGAFLHITVLQPILCFVSSNLHHFRFLLPAFLQRQVISKSADKHIKGKLVLDRVHPLCSHLAATFRSLHRFALQGTALDCHHVRLQTR